MYHSIPLVLLVTRWPPPPFHPFFLQGQEFNSDASTLTDVSAWRAQIVCNVSDRQNSYSSLPPDRLLQLNAHFPATVIVTSLPELYQTALTLADPGLTRGESRMAKDDNSRRGGVWRAAQRLLHVLPTAPAVLERMRQLLSAGSGGEELRRVLTTSDDCSGERLQEALAVYAMQTLCVLLFPAVNPLASEQEAAHDAEESLRMRHRILLSGCLDALLQLLTRHASFQDPQMAADAHRAMVLILTNLCDGFLTEELQQQGAEGVVTTAVASNPPAPSHNHHPQHLSPATITTAGTAPSATTPASVSMASAGGVGSPDAATEAGPMEQDDQQAQRAQRVAARGRLTSLLPACARYLLSMVQAGVLGFRADGMRGSTAALTAREADLAELVRVGLDTLFRVAAADVAVVDWICAGSQQQGGGGEGSARSSGAQELIDVLLVHPSHALREQAGQWLESFAGLSPTAHRWAFGRVAHLLVQSAAAGGDGDVDSSAEQSELCSYFLSTLQSSEVAVAQQLLGALLQQLAGAMDACRPIAGLAGLVLTLVRKLDCREIGSVRGMHHSMREGGGEGGLPLVPPFGSVRSMHHSMREGRGGGGLPQVP